MAGACLAFGTPARGAECIAARPAAVVEPGANQPSDIAIGPNGNLYLVDGVNHRVVVTDDRGGKTFVFGRRGDGPGEFDTPLGIDVAPDGTVFVADTRNHRIQVFDARGRFQRLFTVPSAPGEKPADPVDVVASPFKQYLYVSDNDNHKIKVFHRDGRPAFTWGRFGEGDGEFRYPGMMTRNAFNELFVVDVLNTRVQKFDPEGNFITEISAWGVRPGTVFRPKGVAVDRQRRVFVSDSYMGVVQTFTDLGRFLGVLCTDGAQHAFRTPVGLALDADQRRLWVVEMRANRVSALQLSD